MTSPQIQAIRERYKRSFTEKIELITEHINALPQAEAGVMESAHEMLHKLAGSSGMYGYDDIAALCRVAMLNAQQSKADVLIQNLSELKSALEAYAHPSSV